MIGRIVVIGGGIAGVSTVAALRAGGFDGDLTLVDAGEVPYDRPPLSKEFITGVREIKQIALQPEEWYVEHSVRLLNRTTVTAVRPGAARVELSDGGGLPADRVVLATGGRAARPLIPGGASDRVHVLRTVQDAERLRAALVPGATVLVVGARPHRRRGCLHRTRRGLPGRARRPGAPATGDRVRRRDRRLAA